MALNVAKKILKSSKYFSWDSNGGEVGANELFSAVYCNATTGVCYFKFYKAGYGWAAATMGQARYTKLASESLLIAYTGSKGTSATISDNLGRLQSGYTFPVRRKARIFLGSDATGGMSEYTSIYAGDLVLVDGSGECSYYYPDRLRVKAYRKNGVWYGNGGWVDTDINIGYCMAHNVTIYSTKW